MEFLTAKCEKCGHENPEGAEFCTQCGASLLIKKRYDRYEKGRSEKQEKDERDVCFGGSGTGGMFWLIIGIVIILWGITQLINAYWHWNIELLPLIVIVIGLYLVYRYLKRR